MVETYRLSFTFGGLLLPETKTLARSYKELGDWALLRGEVLSGSILRKTRESSRYRYFREIRLRLEQAWPFEIDAIASEAEECRFIIFAICSRYYRLIGDFLSEVLADKIAMKQPKLGLDDYYHFIESKRSIHPELVSLSPTTEKKIRQVVFRMLIEGGFLCSDTWELITPSIPDRLIRQYKETDDYESLHNLLYGRSPV